MAEVNPAEISAILKKRVPIWKWAILKDGTKIPSECRYH